MSRRSAFPLGASVTAEALARDPYPILARLQAQEPVSWIEALDMWYVTRHGDVQQVLLDVESYTTAFERSTIHDTFGEQMLTSEGARHDRYRRAVQNDFSAAKVRAGLEARIQILVARLIDQISGLGTAEMRASFAARLPIQTILQMCGLPLEAEPRVRGWYDRFERALANFTGDRVIREEAGVAIEEFHQFLQGAIEAAPAAQEPSLLGRLALMAGEARLSDDEIKRNLSIIFFGGISTVEALILNCLWALSQDADLMAVVKSDGASVTDLIEETIRWRSPVQSATRHARRAVVLGEARIEEGEVVNCMLGAANRDPRVFANPESFLLRRPNIRRHLGFAMGPHACLGLNLARLEARIAVESLLSQLEGFEVVGQLTEPPGGYEFHQPSRLQAAWTIPA